MQKHKNLPKAYKTYTIHRAGCRASDDQEVQIPIHICESYRHSKLWGWSHQPMEGYLCPTTEDQCWQYEDGVLLGGCDFDYPIIIGFTRRDGITLTYIRLQIESHLIQLPAFVSQPNPIIMGTNIGTLLFQYNP